ncbi:MAG: dimethyl sulfoxide reductase anchor subunit [Gammaproteobacteria bacterium]|nr:dimethyl sulfoxide reductase anchor subunit [Gammaproteobacteria bacterium]
MHPAFSVIFLTTLIGVGQGLFIALYSAQAYSAIGVLPKPALVFMTTGSVFSVAFLVGGLVASIFHLGRPERAWRSAAMWRTSWLSREVIVLPMAIAAVAAYGVIHYQGWDLTLIGITPPFPGALSLLVGTLTTVVIFALFVCTGMIYACIRFLQEWASPLTVINYMLIGTGSGFTFAAALSTQYEPALTLFFAGWALALTLFALITRSASLIRNQRIKYRSTIQSAIGVRHTRIRQESQGFLGGSFNTREFFHGAHPWIFRFIKWLFIVLGFIMPALLLGYGISSDAPKLFIFAFFVQYVGLIAERWFFFAQANHPQNLYYQLVS